MRMDRLSFAVVVCKRTVAVSSGYLKRVLIALRVAPATKPDKDSSLADGLAVVGARGERRFVTSAALAAATGRDAKEIRNAVRLCGLLLWLFCEWATFSSPNETQESTF